MKPTILLIGGGGHCKACVDVIEEENRYKIAGIVDVEEKKGQKILGYEVIGSDSDLPKLMQTHSNCLITIGQIKSPAKRISVFSILSELGACFPSIISPKAHVSRHSTIAEGTIVMHGASINASASIGSHCIINTNAVIEHDATIKDFCHISIGAVVNGGTIVNYNTFIGSNTVIREYIEIGENSFVGFGLRVRSSLPKNSKHTPVNG